MAKKILDANFANKQYFITVYCVCIKISVITNWNADNTVSV